VPSFYDGSHSSFLFIANVEVQLFVTQLQHVERERVVISEMTQKKHFSLERRGMLCSLLELTSSPLSESLLMIDNNLYTK
jgi:hypothetical protein